jgi:hypothetical protein
MAIENSDQSAQNNDQQIVNATIVANGAILIALQTAMRWAIIESTKMSRGDLDRLVARISSEVTKAPADGFDLEDVKVGKAQVMKFVDIISGALARELVAKNYAQSAKMASLEL